MTHDSVDDCLRWRCDQDISHEHYKRAVEQLREASNGSLVAIPTSNPRPKLKQDAEVEAEDASGVWRWAKITACHEDGTFNVYIYDDNAGGGQDWDDMRPVHLRSRSQRVRPKGIACGPPADIPRWDDDDGAAFTAAIAAYANAVIKDSNKRPLGYWEAKNKDNSDNPSSDSNFESELSDLLEDETEVQNTPDEAHTHSTDGQRQNRARSRLSKEKRNPRDANTKSSRRENDKSRSRASQSGQTVTHKLSKGGKSKLHMNVSKGKSKLHMNAEGPASNGYPGGASIMACHQNTPRSDQGIGRKHSKGKSQVHLDAQQAALNGHRGGASTTRRLSLPNCSLAKIKQVSETTKHSHASMRHSKSADSLFSKSKNPMGQLKTIVCTIPLPASVADGPNSLEHDDKEANYEMPSGLNSEIIVPSKDSLSAYGKVLGKKSQGCLRARAKKRKPLRKSRRRFNSAPDVYCNSTYVLSSKSYNENGSQIGTAHKIPNT